jgi:hypothetical protein
MRYLPIAIALLLLPGCAEFRTTPGVIAQPSADWRSVATESDRERLRDWRGAFVDGLRSARAAGHGAEIEREGVLLNPDAALGGGPIPNGDYRCRVIKVGAKQAGLLNYVAYPYFACRIAADGQIQDFAKLNGSQRQVGKIFPGDMLRQVFLGTLVLGDESDAMRYGHDTQRDVAGFVERIGPDRWRLIMPSPHFESQIDVMELVPSSQGAR